MSENRDLAIEHTKKLGDFLESMKESGIADGFALIGYKQIDDKTIAKIFAMQGDEAMLAAAYNYAKEEPKFYNVLIVASMLELERIDTSKLSKESE